MRRSHTNSLKVRLWLGGVVLIVLAFALAGCVSRTPPVRPAPPAISTVAHYISGKEVVVDVTWTPESNCSACHKNEGESIVDERPAAKHTESTCADCHTDEVILKETHADLVQALKTDPPKRLMNTSVDSPLCISCHEIETIKTGSAGVLVDAAGNTFNPHDISNSESHNSITCIDCHEMHSTKQPLELAVSTCDSCHHEGIYVSCISCHE